MGAVKLNPKTNTQMPGHATKTHPEKKAPCCSSVSILSPKTNKCAGAPTIRKDTLEHLPAFYQAAIRVLERNHHVVILEV